MTVVISLSYSPKAIYDDNGLFEFEEFNGTCSLKYYLKKDDPNITEIEIPAECRGFPVRSAEFAFSEAKYIKHVKIPPSIRSIGDFCFYNCISLESVEFSEGLGAIGRCAFMYDVSLKTLAFPKSLDAVFLRAFAYCVNLESVAPNFPTNWGEQVFLGCDKLPAEVILMDLVCRSDITQPLNERAYSGAFELDSPENIDPRQSYTRPDVLELAIKNDSFRSVDVFLLLEFLVEEGSAESLLLARELGLLKTREQADEYISRSVEAGTTELTAYLLDYKNRKFGFDGGGDFEL